MVGQQKEEKTSYNNEKVIALNNRKTTTNTMRGQHQTSQLVREPMKRFSYIKRQLFCGLMALSSSESKQEEEEEEHKTVSKFSSSSSSPTTTTTTATQVINNRGQFEAKEVPLEDCQFQEKITTKTSDEDEVEHENEFELEAKKVTNLNSRFIVDNNKNDNNKTTDDHYSSAQKNPSYPSCRKISTGSEPIITKALNNNNNNNNKKQQPANNNDHNHEHDNEQERLIKIVDEILYKKTSGQNNNNFNNLFQLEENWTSFVNIVEVDVDNNNNNDNEHFSAANLSQDNTTRVGALINSSCNNNNNNNDLKIQQDAIWELYTTEVFYLRGLKVIIDLFLSTLNDLQKKHSLLMEIDCKKMSSNICEIYQANLILLKDHLEPMVSRARLNNSPIDPSLMLNGFIQVSSSYLFFF